MTDGTDYRRFYDDEEYLLDVGRAFRETGKLDAPDFYMLLMWKANRAKNYHRDRLKRLSGTFQAAVTAIAKELFASAAPKERLQLLMDRWEFALPTAIAILALLYPDDFTVYDRRVCDEVALPYRPWRPFPQKLWDEYEGFVQAVIAATPKLLIAARQGPIPDRAFDSQRTSRRLRGLLSDAAALQRSAAIRQYVEAIRTRHACSSIATDAELESWTEWALAQADRIDPAQGSGFLLRMRQTEPDDK